MTVETRSNGSQSFILPERVAKVGTTLYIPSSSRNRVEAGTGMVPPAFVPRDEYGLAPVYQDPSRLKRGMVRNSTGVTREIRPSEVDHKVTR